VAVLGFDHVPARTVEELHQLLDLLTRDHAIEALTIGVDDPGDVAEALECRIRDGFPHVALVEFGVTGQGDEPGAGRTGGTEARFDVTPRGGGEERRDDSEAHRTSGEVGDVGVLRATRIRLQSTDLTQPREVRTIEFSGEVLDRVVHRRRMRFDGHFVFT